MADAAATTAADTASAGATATQAQVTDLETKIASLGTDLKSLSENINKISEALAASANFNTTVQGVDDPYENKRRDRLAYDAMQQFTMGVMAGIVQNHDALMKQHMRIIDVAAARHWGTSPETANPTGTAPKA